MLFKIKNMIPIQNTKALIILLTAVAFVGGIFTYYTWHAEINRTKIDAMQGARMMAIAINGEMLEKLTGTAEDIGTTAYESMKSRLMELQKVDGKIRFAYLFTQRNEKIYFMVDSEPIHSKDYSPPGQEYVEDNETLFGIFNSKEALISENNTDSWGTWASVLIPLEDASGNAYAIFGVDYAMDVWLSHAINHAVRMIVFTFLALFLVFAIFVIISKNAIIKKNAQSLSNIIKGTNIGTWEWNVQTGDVIINERWAQIIGYQLKELQPISILTWQKFVHPEDLKVSNAQIEKVFSREIDYYDCALRMKHKDGSWVWVQDSGMVTRWDSEGKPLWISGSHMDITDKRKMEEKMIESETNFRSFFESAADMIFVANREGNIFHVNEAVLHTLGYQKEELQNMHVLDVHPKEKREEAERIFGEMFAGVRDTCLISLEKKDGTTIPVETRVWFGQWDGKACIFGISKDLTAQTEALDKFYKAFQKNPALMAVSNMSDRNFIDANQAFLETLGYQKEEVIGKSTSELGLFVEPEKHKMVSNMLGKDGIIKNIELQVRKKDGTVLTGLFSGEIISNQLEPLFLTVMIDITAAKENEKELIYQKNLLEGIINSVPDVLAIQYPDHTIERYNEAGYKMLNRCYEEVKGKKCYELMGYDAECQDCASRMALEAKKPAHSKKYIPETGAYLDCISAPILDDHGEVIKIIEQIRDVTQQTLDHSKIVESEKRYRLLTSQMQFGLALHEMIYDDNGNPADYRFISANDSFERITGLRKEDILGKTVLELLPNTKKYWIDLYGKVAKTGEASQFQNYSMELDKFFEVSAYSPKQGQFATIISDITDRVKNEKTILESKNKLKGYFDGAPDGIFIIDNTGHYLDANLAASTLTGYSKEELLSMSIFDITPKEYHLKAKEAFDEMLRKKSVYIEFPYIKKDGQGRIWSISASKLNAEEFIGFTKDITEKIELDNKLKYTYYHDSMTGLLNRSYIFDNIKSIDCESHFPMTIVYADINGLRSINESFGLVLGDEIIKKVAVAIQNTFEKSIAVRWGGDDFLIFVSNKNEEDAKKMVGKFKANLKLTLTDELKNISVSIGCYTKHDKSIVLTEAIRHADENMLQNKIASKDSVHNTPINMILHTLHEKNMREERHSKRVSEICVAIGQTMEMSSEDVNKLKMIGLVHDIGKIGIAETILNKPSKLTLRECEIMKQHSEIGFRILSANKRTAELAYHILLHHERIDGSGYPNGIKGGELSLFTKILSVADAFDAMTRKRAYCDGISTQEAVNELERCSHAQFDAGVVDVFVHRVLINNCDFSDGEESSHFYNII